MGQGLAADIGADAGGADAVVEDFGLARLLAHPDGNIDIKRGDGGKLSIEGQQFVPTAHDFHTGEVQAPATPEKDTLAFVDDGSIPFEKTDEGGCRVRMQRIGPWLLVEDNDNCGDAAVTFSGLYRRK